MMIELDRTTLHRLHLNQLLLLNELDRICMKYSINYSIIGGTMLGAVRHGGYIPWDDDADVGLLRSDYEKLRCVLEQELDAKRFYFQDDRNTDGYRWGYGKLRLINTLFLRENQEHMKFGQEVFIDIFPLDNVPDNYILRIFHCMNCFVIRKFLWSAVVRIEDRSKLKRLAYQLMYLVPKERIYKHYYKLINKWNRRTTKNVRISLFPHTRHYGIDRTIFEETKPVCFEGYMLQGVKRYDAYLTEKYGDYMTIPPENERKVHAVTAIKLLDLM